MDDDGKLQDDIPIPLGFVTKMVQRSTVRNVTSGPLGQISKEESSKSGLSIWCAAIVGIDWITFEDPCTKLMS